LSRVLWALVTIAGTLVIFPAGTVAANGAHSESVLSRFLSDVPAATMFPGADQYGGAVDGMPVEKIEKDGQVVGYLFATSDFVGTTGYSGKPIHVLVALSMDGTVASAKLVEHSEPIVLIGIPERKINDLIDRYSGLDIVVEAEAGGSGHDVDIISGATVTVMVIDDSIVRSALKVARGLALGGLAPLAARQGPARVIDPEAQEPKSWDDAVGSGAIRRFTLDVGQLNATFERSGDAAAIARPELGDPSDPFLGIATTLVSVPALGRAMLGAAEFKNLQAWLGPDEHAILIAGRGRYSFKGSGYVRGGIFDRFYLIQGDRSVRFRDRMHRRLGEITLEGAPSFTELDLFRIPADSGFDPTQPWRLQFLVHRAIGPLKKSFQTFDLGFRLPEAYTRPDATVRSTGTASDSVQSEREAVYALWKRVWYGSRIEIAVLGAMLIVLTAAFFFQMQLTRHPRLTFWFRIGFLSVTVLFLGWYANAQLSVVNLLVLANSVKTSFSWDAFLLDPMVFILWFSLAASLIFWGRGAYCGWLCPFGALQELTNRLAKLCRIPQVVVPWGLHERLWPLKYILFLGLFGVSLVSLPLSEQLAEVEPFKTAIILKFQRAWPFVVFALATLAIGLFIERFYCRYVCPLGAALAIPGRLRMFAWLKRYHECGNPCQTCHNECMVQAIHPTGEINPNECLYCLHCQVRYQDTDVCPVCIKQHRRRQRLAGLNPDVDTKSASASAHGATTQGELL